MPRTVSARAVDEISYLSIDSELLDVMITWDQTGTYEVAELQAQLEGAGSDDWMTTLLQTKAFHRIPPANIQAIFLRLQRTPFRAGEVVIKQGDEGDYFYAIVQGKCLVTRESPLNQKGIKLAVNAGASDTEMLAKVVKKAIEDAGLTLKVAWIQGDEVLDVVNRLLKEGEKFENICFGGNLEDWGFEPLAAQ